MNGWDNDSLLMLSKACIPTCKDSNLNICNGFKGTNLTSLGRYMSLGLGFFCYVQTPRSREDPHYGISSNFEKLQWFIQYSWECER